MTARTVREGGAMTSTSDRPAGAQLNITATIDHDHAELALTGEIDITDADQLLMCIQWYLRAPQITHVAVNLCALRFIDAAGIRTFVLSRRDAGQLGKTFVITN